MPENRLRTAALVALVILGASGCTRPNPDYRPDHLFACVQPPPANLPFTVKVPCVAGGWPSLCVADLAAAQAECAMKSCTALGTGDSAALERLYAWDITFGLKSCMAPGTLVFANMTAECVDVSMPPARAVDTTQDPNCTAPSHVKTDIYFCVYPNPDATCPPGSTPSSGSALTIAPAYQATVRPVAAAHVVSDQDTSKEGTAIGRPGLPSLQFDRNAGGLTLQALAVPVNDFVFDGNQRLHGTVLLENPGVVAVGSGPSFAVPAGAAQIVMGAVDADGGGYRISASNTTPLVVSSLDDPGGPRVTGTVAGSLDGHPVHADVEARFGWINRPPHAVAHGSNVTFDSSQLEPCKSDPMHPACQQERLCRFPCLRPVRWIGLKNTTVAVELDASDSWDPDPAERLLYAWNGQAPSTQPVTAWAYGHGPHSAIVTVQDRSGATAMTSVSFTVTDKAVPGCGECDPILVAPPQSFVVRMPIPRELIAAIEHRDFARSEGELIVSPTSLPQIEALARGDRALARRLFAQARSVDLGELRARMLDAPDPFASACSSAPTGSPGGTAFCAAACGNGRCEQGETCAACAGDCGACTTCGNGQCDGDERCSSCPQDCGVCSTCGNGLCDRGETAGSCREDCRCGNGTCDAGEDGRECKPDCYCGNGVCDPGENGGSCAHDCRCGNGTCDPQETHAGCLGDCPCGDGRCDPLETCESCSTDCGGCSLGQRVRAWMSRRK